MCICEDICKSLGMQSLGKMAFTLKFSFSKTWHSDHICFVDLAPLRWKSIPNPWLIDYTLGLFYYWLCFRKLHCLLCCVDIMNHFASGSKFTLVWMIGCSKRDNSDMDAFTGVSKECRGGFPIVEQLLYLKKMAAKRCMGEVNLLW